MTKAEAKIEFHGPGDRQLQHCSELLGILDQALAEPPFDSISVAKLEQRCATLLQRQHAAAVGSGTAALTLALEACGIGPGDEVIVPAFSFIASASPILHVGATPVYVPVRPDDLHMCPDSVASARRPTTRAVVAVHLFGRCHPDIEHLVKLCADSGIWLIEDAAQALDAGHRDRPAGSFGDIATISFDPTKVVGGITTGGLVATDRPTLDQKIRQLRCHGYEPATGKFSRLGHNSRMASISAAAILAALSHQPAWHAARETIAMRYRTIVDGHPAIDVVTGQIDQESRQNHHKFVIRTGDRHNLRAWLSQHGVPTKVHYDRVLPDLPALAGHGCLHRTISSARKAATEVLSLPIHPWLDANQLDHILDTIERWAP